MSDRIDDGQMGPIPPPEASGRNDGPAESEVRVEPVGDRSLQIAFGEAIEAGVNDRVHACAHLLRELQLPGVLDLVPAYATLTVHYDPVAWAGLPAPPHAILSELLGGLARSGGASASAAPRRVEIPVCYGGIHGPDLSEVAGHCGMTPEEVIRRHTAPEYRVFMLGFAPGFPYLGGLDPALAVPRRPTPRTRIPAGSVAIGGMQTGVYSLETPGGWRIIGRTPMRLFQPEAADPCLLKPGDRVVFVAVEPAQFQEGRP